MYNYTCLNPIAGVGLNLFSEDYNKVEDIKDADAALKAFTEVVEGTLKAGDSIQLVVQFGTHRAQIHVALVIPENGNLRFAVNGAVAVHGAAYLYAFVGRVLKIL